MTFSLRHPDPDQPHLRADYGFDPDRGYFAEVVEERHIVRTYWLLTHSMVEHVEPGGVRDRYDLWSHQYDAVRPVRGLLDFMARKGFLDSGEVEEAVDLLQTCGIDALPRRLWRVGRVIRNLDEAGG